MEDGRWKMEDGGMRGLAEKWGAEKRGREWGLYGGENAAMFLA
jgi:hypothetical protein